MSWFFGRGVTLGEEEGKLYKEEPAWEELALGDLAVQP